MNIPEPTAEDIECLTKIMNNMPEIPRAVLTNMLSKWSQCAGIAKGMQQMIGQNSWPISTTQIKYPTVEIT